MTITEFNNICKSLVAYAGIDGHVLVADEKHAVNKLRDRPGIWLAAVMPSTEVDGEPDAEIETYTTLLFVLESADLGQDDADELAQYQRTQTAIIKIREYISNDQSNGCGTFSRFDPDESVINPEYQIFSDRNGWSMTLVF